MTKTPAASGFRMPAEWAPHARTWMGWPCRRSLWGDQLDQARASYANVARAIARFEPLTMVAHPDDAAQAAAMCGPGIDILPLPIDDSWMRDSGPTFLTNAAGEIAGADWGFNAWGGKFPPWNQDADIAGKILRHLGIPAFKTPYILEGGSIHVDGEGTLITTEQCLLHPNRNPTMSRAEIETTLRDWLGVSTIIWLGEGIENDETDGHVDDITCFVRPGTVITAVCDDHTDPNHAPLTENLRRLRAARDAKGRALEIIEMPMPGRREVPDIGRLCSSYVNFYLANGAVIVPGFDDPNDPVAVRILQSAFPDRTVVMVDCQTIIRGGGSIHCITQQQPAGPAARSL